RTPARADPVPAAVAHAHLPDAESGFAAAEVPAMKPHPDWCRTLEAKSGGKTATSKFRFFPAAPPVRARAALPRSAPFPARSQSAALRGKSPGLSSPIQKASGLAENTHQTRQAGKPPA